jgi:hypothetical protein
MGLTVCDVTVGYRAAFGDAAALGLSVLEHDRAGRAADEVRQVYHAVIGLLEKGEPNQRKAQARVA